MARQELVARRKRRRRHLTQPDKAAKPVSDLLGRDFSVFRVGEKWCGDLSEIPTEEGKFRRPAGPSHGWLRHGPGSRRYPATAALQMAAAAGGGRVDGVVCHSDKGSDSGFGASDSRLA